MPDFDISCPHCGGAITYSVGAKPRIALAQTAPQSGANVAQVSEIAHVSGSQVSFSLPKTKVYNQGYEQEFLLFWKHYPLKRDKRKAQSAWRKSVARIVATTDANATEAMAQILAGAIRLRDDPNRVDQFTKYAEGWLNGDGWEDEPLPARSNGRVTDDRAGKALRRLAGRQA